MSRRNATVSSVLTAFILFVGFNLADAAEATHSQTEVKLIKKTDRTEVQFTQQAERLEARNRITIKLGRCKRQQCQADSTRYK